VLEATAGGGYSIPDEDSFHAVATDPINLSAARRGSLYPDHVVFLGPGIVTADSGERAVDASRRCGRNSVPLVVVPGAGVLVHETATPGARALIRCLADVTSRLQADDPIAPLSADDEAQLLNWDAEKYRRSLDIKSPDSKTS
jgi:rhamnose utilization protein RhaD (predicted bifunctional aldolase and dehydrogenase)